jgi:PAS domain S-box-containing protein
MNDLCRQVFDEMPCFVTVQDRDLRIVAANRMFREEFGDRIGASCYEVYKGRPDVCPECPVELTFADGQRHRSEQVVKTKDGEDKCVLVYTSPLHGDNGEITGVVEMSADITQVKRLQQKFRALFDEVPCYISVQDRDLKLTDANRRFQEDFGDMVGASCYEVYKHRDEPCLTCPVAKTFQDGKTHHSEEVVTTRSGRRENVFCSTAPIRDPAGEIVEVMEMSADITELRQVQDRLTSLGLLVGSISHGIKGLLNGLDGGIYLMETGFKKEKMDRVKKGWDMMQRNVDRIRSMVLNVLYYAKDREVIWSEIGLEEITSSVANVLSGRAGQLGVTLDVQSTGGTFEGDANAVHAMLVNLVENSLDACRLDKKQAQHQVTISSGVDGDQATFDISDNGIGMDRETREKAFSLFFSSKGTEGTGLGMFIAHKIVTNHHGSIEIDSTPGQGTRFSVRLPRKRVEQPPAPEPEAEAATDEAAQNVARQQGWDKVL